MVSGINAVLNEAGTEIAAEQTRMLQALTAREPNRNAADFYLAGMEEKRKNAQTAIDGLWLDAIERMPLIDKKTYMKLYMKNRFLRNTGIVVPPFIAADDTCAGEF